MYSEKNWTKPLCNAFKLPEVGWLPSSVAFLLSYLLENPSSLVEGNIFYLQIKEHMTTAQLLTLLPARGEIIVEKPLSFFHDSTKPLTHNVAFFLREHLVAYAADLAIYNNGLWDFDQVLLKVDNYQVDDIKEIINKFWGAVPVITTNKNPEAIINELSPESYSRQTFNSVLIIYPQHFYIEKNCAESANTQLELIPFASENLALNIGQRYKIFSFTADSEYNLAGEKNLLRVKLYEKSFADSVPETVKEPQLILEHTGELNNNQAAINIYLNLALGHLEFDYTSGYSAFSAPDDVIQELQKRQLIGYDFISDSQLINPQLISDFGLHLKQGENNPVSSQYISKTVYFKALALLSLLSGKK